MGISPHHVDLLRDAAVPQLVAEKAGLISVTTDAELPAAFKDAPVPGLMFPWVSPDNVTLMLQYRPDEPGDGPKYLMPQGLAPVLWVHPDTPELTRTAPDLILMVEGTKQFLAAYAAADPRTLVVGLTGCTGWVHNGVFVRCFNFLPLVDSSVVIMFDGDVKTNHDVWLAASKLAGNLDTFGAASIRYVIPDTYGFNGLDDVLAQVNEGDRPRFLLSLIGKASDKLGRAPARKKLTVAERREAALLAMAEDRAKAMEAGVMMSPTDYFLLSGFNTAMFSEDVRRVFSLLALPDGRISLYGNDGRYPMSDNTFTVKVMHESLADLWTPADENAAKRHVWEQLIHEGKGSTLDPHPGYVNCTNGMINMATGRLEAHSPTHRSLAQIPVVYDSEATCEFFLDWLTDKVGKDQVEGLLLGLAEVLVLGRLSKPVIFLYGASRSGKGTLLRLIGELIGSDNYASPTIHQLSNDKFSSAQLYGKMACIQGDLSSAHLADLSMLKSLTGDDDIEAQRKYGQPFKFRYRGLLLFAGNEPPTMTEESAALINRWLPVHFSTTHAGNEDRLIEDRLRDELPGLLVELVKRASELLAHPELRGRAPRRVMEDFAGKTDRVHAFLLQNYVPDPVCEISTEGVWKEWSAQTRSDPSFKTLGRTKFLHRADVILGERVKVMRTKNGWKGWRSRRDDDEDTGFRTKKPDFPPTLNQSGNGIYREEEESVQKEVEGGLGKTWSSGATPLSSLIVDIETASASRLYLPTPSDGFLRLVAIRNRENSFREVIPIHPDLPENADRVRELLTGAEKLVLHNGLMFDLPALALHLGLDFTELAEKTTDTDLLARIILPPVSGKGGRKRTQYDLDALALRYLGEGKAMSLPTYAADWVKLLRKAKLDVPADKYEAIPRGDMTYQDYALVDVDRCWDLFLALQRKWVEGGNGTSDELRERYLTERRVATIATTMSMAGVKVDIGWARTLDAEYNAACTEANAVLRRRAPKVKVGVSPIRSKFGKEPIGDFLVSQGVELERTEKAEEWSLTSDALRPYADVEGEVGEIVRAALTINDRPLATTLLHAPDAGADTWIAEDGAVHTKFKPSAQASGRWSSTEPAMLNIAKRNPVKKDRDRGMFIARKGHQLLSIDLGQIDARCVAFYSGDPLYRAIFLGGRDLHAEVALIAFGDEKLRDRAKPLSHGTNYGLSVTGVMRETGLPEAEAADIHDRLLGAFPGLVAWQEAVRDDARWNGYITNHFGRRVIVSFDDAYTGAPAAFGQSTTTDIINRGLLRLIDAHPEVLSMLRLQIHDEVVLEIPTGSHDEIGPWVVEAMTAEPLGEIPITAEASEPGDRWSDL